MTQKELEDLSNKIVVATTLLANDSNVVFMTFVIDTSVTPHHMSIRSNLTQEDAKELVTEIAQRMNGGDLACQVH